MGHDVRRDYRAARRSVGIVPQEVVFDPFFTVRETLRIQSGYFGLRSNDAWIDEVMHHLDLASKRVRSRRPPATIRRASTWTSSPVMRCSRGR